MESIHIVNQFLVFSQGAWSLDLGRLLIGCGVGVLSYVVIAVVASCNFKIYVSLLIHMLAKDVSSIKKQVPVYIAEITPKNLRGGFTAVNQVFHKIRTIISLQIVLDLQHTHLYLSDSTADDMLWCLNNVCHRGFYQLAHLGCTW